MWALLVSSKDIPNVGPLNAEQSGCLISPESILLLLQLLAFAKNVNKSALNMIAGEFVGSVCLTFPSLLWACFYLHG